MASIATLPVKTLVKVLTHLSGGNIGFDPYRDPRTSKKEPLLAYILANYSNEAIIGAIAAVIQDEGHTSDGLPTVPVPPAIAANWNFWYVKYKDISHQEFTHIAQSLADADKFISENPTNHYLGKFNEQQWKAHNAAKDTFETDWQKLKARQIATAYGASEKTTNTTPTAPVETDEASKIAALLASMASKGNIDEAKVRNICDARAQDYVDNILGAVNGRLDGYDAKIARLQMPVTVHFMPSPDAKPVDLGIQHKAFPNLLKMAQARTRDGHKLNIWLKGPAGSGKTTAAKKVAEALDQPFQFNGAISTEYELMGFRDAAGNYHTTAFREVFENGGVYLFDEVDSSLPKAVLAFNAALANGECRFPDKMVNRHKDCVIIAGANTAGNGANSDYVGRMKQDLAFLNRFVMLDWPLDEALEKALSANKDWVKRVQKFRAQCKKRGIKGHIVSPRATFYGEALIAAGLDYETVSHAVLRGSLSDDTWDQLENGTNEIPF